MLDQHINHFHQNDREEQARRLGMSLARFDALLDSANHAYEVIKELGPFYGQEDIKEPTFRITAEPVVLPEGSKAMLTELGKDLFQLAKALRHLPENFKKDLGEPIDFSIAPTWRIDSIVDKNDHIKVNEIEGVDGASALMIAEQLAYGLQTLNDSTAAKLIQTLKAMCQPQENSVYKIGLILNFSWTQAANTKKFVNFLEILSKGTIAIELLDLEALQEGTLKPDWEQYAGIINDRAFSKVELEALGVKPHQMLTMGSYHAICNKGIFALLFENDLHTFWTEQLGKERFGRLQTALPHSTFIRTIEDLERARAKGQVVKVTWTTTNKELIYRSRGVAMPQGDTEHASDERWNVLRDLLAEDVIMIAQDFVEPAQLPAYLRKKGVNLEFVQWYNRLCVKYVVEGNPNDEATDTVLLTAAEVTLGPNVIPAGRKCAFTAAKLV